MCVSPVTNWRVVFSTDHVSLPKTILATSCTVIGVLCIFWEAGPNTAQGCSVFFSLEILYKSNFFNSLFKVENYTGKENKLSQPSLGDHSLLEICLPFGFKCADRSLRTSNTSFNKSLDSGIWNFGWSK